jgi:dienelactone hydrolase
MASLIPGYNYDIFISYRQKDNKGDRWVSEFVEALKTELESTFKEEISVYFDINPQDGLLETHDVNASLKEKLKCLVCIPIISRTYCDPKSFAWEHEFKAFVEQASRDQFGLKVKLYGGNIANRILPVRIHDLDQADIKLFESTIGGALRSIDFVYKETGVNRQLRAKDDDIIKSPGQILYRDQINKVALAIKDIIESMRSTAGTDKSKEKEIPAEGRVDKKVFIPEDADIAGKSEITDKTTTDKLKPGKSSKSKGLPVKVKKLFGGIILILAVLTAALLILNHRTKVRWAREQALPELKRLTNEEESEENYIKAFDLAQKAEKYISDDPDFRKTASDFIGKLTIMSDPPDANVYIRKYAGDEGEWKKIGKTPVDTMKLPNWTYYQVKLVKKGYDDVFAIASTDYDTLYRKMFRTGEIPAGMVYVDGIDTEIIRNVLKDKNGFFLDRYEVTNKQYKEFVDKGGYSNPDYWKNEFIKDGKTLTREEAMAEFTDKSGRPGPSTWEAGDYPDGLDDYPVSGVSWYEAAAYAEYAGKSLPTQIHWTSGAGFPYDWRNWDYNGSYNRILTYSNFNDKGPAPVGKFHGISHFGAYDMAGNVREWNWNKTKIGCIVRGGAWDDRYYMYPFWSQLPTFDRSPKNGFRCVRYINKERIPQQTFQEVNFVGQKDYSKEKPVSESVFKAYRNQFLYDKTDLNARIEDRDESPEDWVVEKISFNAAYGNEKVTAYLYLPKNGVPPYQTIIYFPGGSAIKGKDAKDFNGFIWMNDYLLKNGRAVIFPIYRGTYERNNGLTMEMGDPNYSHQFTEWLIWWTKDFSRTIDYLETRSDIDTGKIAFYGWSWGGEIGAYIPAVEDRVKLNILVLGGLYGPTYPEAYQVNYLPRIKIPVLMLNGKYDMFNLYETSVKPFYDFLGTPEKDKRLCLFEADHSLYKNDMIKEVLSWLDKYFGPVKPLPTK